MKCGSGGDFSYKQTHDTVANKKAKLKNWKKCTYTHLYKFLKEQSRSTGSVCIPLPIKTCVCVCAGVCGSVFPLPQYAKIFASVRISWGLFLARKVTGQNAILNADWHVCASTLGQPLSVCRNVYKMQYVLGRSYMLADGFNLIWPHAAVHLHEYQKHSKCTLSIFHVTLRSTKY